MASLNLRTFGGFVPRVASTLLQDNEAQEAVNVKLYSGALESWRKTYPTTPIISVPSGTQTIFKTKNNFGDTIWIGWTSDVDYVNSPLTDTNSFRIFYTGDGRPKKTNTALTGSINQTYSPSASLEMGVWAPDTAPTLTLNHNGGGALANVESRAYVYTNISTFGDIKEESGPSPASLIDYDHENDTVDVSGFVSPPSGYDYNITHRRIYRSVTGSTATSFQFVAEIPVSTTTYTDSVESADLGEIMPSFYWEEPPSDLKGLVAMPNGFLAGFVGNEVYFSEPYYPHAWPSGYSMSVNDEIVGLGVTGTSLVVLTTGNPVVISGITPESMSQDKMPLPEPCLSKKSIAEDVGGVFYASPNGLVLIGPGVSQIVTSNLFTRKEWEKFGPATINGVVSNGRYFGFFEYDNIKKSFILDRNVSATPLSTSIVHAEASFVDIEDSSLYLVEGGLLKVWDSDPYNIFPYSWKSKKFVFAKPINFGVFQIDADFQEQVVVDEINSEVDVVAAENQALFAANDDLKSTFNSFSLNYQPLNGSLLKQLPPGAEDRYVEITIYANGEEKYTTRITDTNMHRLPSGYKSDTWEIRLNGNVRLRHMKIAETASGLKQV